MRGHRLRPRRRSCRRDRRRRRRTVRPGIGDPAAGHRHPGRADDHTVRASLLHHIATDEWSDAPFLRRPDAAYRRGSAAQRASAATAAGAVRRLHAVAARIARYRTIGRAQQQLTSGAKTLAGAPDELALPTDRTRPARPSCRRRRGASRRSAPRRPLRHCVLWPPNARVSMLMVLHAASRRCCTGSVRATTSPSARRSPAAANRRSTT